jgi:hypothetical protein
MLGTLLPFICNVFARCGNTVWICDPSSRSSSEALCIPVSAGIPSETLSLYGNPCIPEQLLKEGMYKIVGGAAKNNSRLQY